MPEGARERQLRVSAWMRVDLFDFDLPEERIALRPAEPRDAARLLVVRRGAEPPFAARSVRDLPDLLRPGDALVLNDTRVIPARLLRSARARARRRRASRSCCTSATAPDRWRALARPAKRLAPGDRIRFGEASESMACLLASLDAEVLEKGEGGEVLLRFAFTGAGARRGRRPARRDRRCRPTSPAGAPPTTRDRADYQTVYAARGRRGRGPDRRPAFHRRAVRAARRARRSRRHFVTLHVGAGTFLPVKAEDTADHRMHAEWGAVDAETAAALNAARRAGRPDRRGRHDRAAAARKRRAPGRHASRRSRGETDLFIAPGYRFRAVDVLMTNFHLPRSTLFMLVCGLRRARDDAGRLRPRDRGGLPVLLLWRRVPAVSARPVIPAGAPD